MNRLLIDTGPLVAIVDKRDQNHGRCVDWLKSYKGDILTTEAVLTEAMHLLKFSYHAQAGCLNFFLSRAIELMPTSSDDL